MFSKISKKKPIQYLVVLDLHRWGVPPLDVLRPPQGALLDLGSGRGMYRRDRTIEIPDVRNIRSRRAPERSRSRMAMLAKW